MNGNHNQGILICIRTEYKGDSLFEILCIRPGRLWIAHPSRPLALHPSSVSLSLSWEYNTVRQNSSILKKNQKHADDRRVIIILQGTVPNGTPGSRAQIKSSHCQIKFIKSQSQPPEAPTSGVHHAQGRKLQKKMQINNGNSSIAKNHDVQSMYESKSFRITEGHKSPCIVYSMNLNAAKSILDNCNRFQNGLEQTCHAEICTSRPHIPRALPLRGVRIGEAKNPGPRHGRKFPTTQEVVLAITNPTSMMNKQTEFDHLVKNHQVQIISCSENSATEEVQKIMDKKFQKLNMHSIWSQPVTQHKPKTSVKPGLRGKAGGTSVHSKWPIRPGQAIPDSLEIGRDRLTTAIVKLGTVHVQIIAFYGVTSSCKGHQQKNEELFQMAIHLSQVLCIPSIIMGDFNVDLTTWEPAQVLLEQGYVSLQQKHLSLYGTSMPVTCKGATTPDSALIHPILASRIKRIDVIKEEIFDSHDPVIFTLETPWEQICTQTIRFPETWLKLPLEKEDLESVVQEAYLEFGEPTDLTSWAQLVETTVDLSIRKEAAKSPELPLLKNLPKRFRGRRTPKNIILAPIMTPCKRAGSGDYNPPQECFSFPSKKW